MRSLPCASSRVLLGVGIGMSLLVGGAWLLIWALPQREASYQGKRLRGWLEGLKNSDAAVSNRAAFVVGTLVIPQLTNQMFQDTNDSKLRMALMERLNGLPGADLYYMPAPFRRAAAAGQLGLIGPRARAAVPALLRALEADQPVVRAKAAKALGDIHADAGVVIPVLIRALSDPSSEVRGSAAEALAGWGKEAQAAVPRLVQLLDDRSDRDLMAAVREALKEIDPGAAGRAGVK